MAHNSFTDANQDVLTYTATLADGSALPAWLSFNATSLTFTGTPISTASGNYTVLVKASDPSGASVSDSFALAVADAPANTITGTNNAETLNGTAGADLILGLGGNDTIKAGTRRGHRRRRRRTRFAVRRRRCRHLPLHQRARKLPRL